MNKEPILETIPEIIPETIPETKEIILNDTVTIHNELKKLTPIERIQILNNIIKEEEAEELIKIQKQEQCVTKCEESNMSRNGCKMFINSKAILSELHNLRSQMNDLQNEVKFMNRNQLNLTNQMQNCRKDELSEYCSNYYSEDNSCNLISFVLDWMPFWIFISFVLFAFIGKPSRLCSISSGIGSAVGNAASCAASCASGVCPITGLGSLGDFVTKM